MAEAVEDRGDVHRVAGGGHGYFFGARGLRRGRAGRVEAPDHFRRQVEPGVGPHQAGVGLAEEQLEPLLAGHRLDHRADLPLEVELQLVLQVLELGLRVLRHALDVDLGLVDVLLDLGRGRLRS